MSLWELFAIAVGLSMDALAVSICKGLAVGRIQPRHALTVGMWFGGFQALMPLLGWLLGTQFQGLIASVDHWIAFVLLALIGGNMIRESRQEEKRNQEMSASFGVRTMLPLAVATSIDALAVGVTFAFLQVDILAAVGVIGVTTFALAAVGIKVGSVFGSRYQTKAEVFGGVVLIGMGVEILLEHLSLIG